VCADDAPAAEEAALHVQQVHGAAAAVGDAGLLAEQLGHHGDRLAAHGQGGAVVAVAGVEAVARLERVDGADGGGLLADREVAVAPMRARVYCSSVRSSKRRISAIMRNRRSAVSLSSRVSGGVSAALAIGKTLAVRLTGVMAVPVTVPRLGEEMYSAILIQFLVPRAARSRAASRCMSWTPTR
jgi:hypothetical protein